jgi:hypothetical protein
MPDKPAITDSHQEILNLMRVVDARTRRMEDELKALLSAWAVGGLRGLRAAARNGRADD